MTDNTELLAQIEALKARVAELERRGQPSAPMKAEPAPFRDLTANATMPPSALRIMTDAVPDHLVRQIANNDRVRAELRPAGTGYTTPPLPRSRNVAAAPLDVPGINLCDKLMDAADRADRVELAKRLAAQELARKKARDDAA